MAFVLEEFIEDCKSACKETDSQAAIAELVKRAVSDPNGIIKALGEPKLAGLESVYNSADLTILNIIWAPKMTLHAHNHCMWADIGIYSGQEENNFFHRTPEGLVQQGQALLNEKDVAPLHTDVIHSVHNPGSKVTAAIHVYGGDYFNAPRSEWTPDTLEEQPFNIDRIRGVFAEANEKILEAEKSGG